jgi:hypothetical protein
MLNSQIALPRVHETLVKNQTSAIFGTAWAKERGREHRRQRGRRADLDLGRIPGRRLAAYVAALEV